MPKEKEVLIKVHATTLRIGDTKIRRLAPGIGPITDFSNKPMMRIMSGFNRLKTKYMEWNLPELLKQRERKLDFLRLVILFV